ncbi:hypothetical protein PR048_032341 [Dryococelus australis]|uniref:Uncharacterized protein n=1 Tax=Dryococelus australis TaxID=614101 RepID=A0ABQ9G1Y1_9NEOP|nr:hypothetical protein PR048_032341 [Dryococelus australis]
MQQREEPNRQRTLNELLEYRQNISSILGESAPWPLYDENYAIVDSETIAVDFILAKDTSRLFLGIQQDILTSGQIAMDKLNLYIFPMINLEEKEREQEAGMECFTDIAIVSLVQHFKDPAEIIAQDIDKVPVTLVETETVSLLDLPSATTQRGSEEGELVERANEHYRNVKAQNRMLISAETQTPIITKKSQSVMTDTIVMRDMGQLATIWKIFDAFASNALTLTMKKTSDATHTAFVGSMEALSSVETPSFTPEEQLLKIVKTDKFKNAVMRMEHILASNVFSTLQTQFKSGHRRELSVIYNYRLQLLWTFCTRELRGRTVTSMCWSPVNENLLAVGYGKFLYRERITGKVCCWSIMNPVNPQRSYHFESPVTAIHFSKVRN